MANPDWDTLQSTTLNLHRDVLADNIFCMNVLWNKLASRKRRSEGGLTIVEPILYGGNNHGRYYSGYDTLPTSPTKGVTSIQNPWAQFSIPVSLCGFEECVNSGRYEVIDLLETKVMQAEKSMKRQWNHDIIHGDGTNPKAIHGLELLVSDMPYGGIDPSQDGCEFWLPCLDDNGYAEWIADGNAPEDFVPQVLDWKVLQEKILELRDCDNMPDCIVMSQELYSGLLSSANGKQGDLQSGELADLGFEHMRFMGIDITYDRDIPEGCVYILNTDALTLWCCKDRFMKFTPFMQPHNQDARIAHIHTMFQLTTNERRAHAKISCLKPAC